MSARLIDGFGREITYVRLSVTDRCDFRCVYCMSEDMTFLPRQQVLSLEEIYRVGRVLVELGVKKIRLTGGEPLIRQNILWLVEKLAALDDLQELTMTTNGSRLKTLAQPLKDAGLDRLNISLDSLNATRFHEITRTGHLSDVLAGITAAKQAGFQRIKLNSVIMRHRNDDEILTLVNFARQQQLDLAFIEEMPLGNISEHQRIDTYISHIGFISPHSHNFCGSCNRVRVTVEGRLLLCLGNEHSADLRAPLRAHSQNDQPLIDTIINALPLKPERHYFDLDESPQIVRFMNMTGG